MLLGKMENHCGKNNQVSSVEHMEQHSLLARWGSGGLSCGHPIPGGCGQNTKILENRDKDSEGPIREDLGLLVLRSRTLTSIPFEAVLGHVRSSWEEGRVSFTPPAPGQH